MSLFDRVSSIALQFPEAELVYVEAWGDHPTFRVRGKNFVFASGDGRSLTVKLPREEADAVVATDDRAEPAGYGLGRHGWVALTLPARIGEDAWRELEEWIETSYLMVAPKRLAREWEARRAGA